MCYQKQINFSTLWSIVPYQLLLLHSVYTTNKKYFNKVYKHFASNKSKCSFLNLVTKNVEIVREYYFHL